MEVGRPFSKPGHLRQHLRCWGNGARMDGDARYDLVETPKTLDTLRRPQES